MKKHFSLIFLLVGLFALLGGALIGVLISMVYVFPDFLNDFIPFNQLRPMHTTFVVSWIIMTAVGGIYFYITKIENLKLYSPKLAVAHIVLYLILALIIPFAYITQRMGGREYLEFSPYLILPILLGWFFFGINYFKTMLRQVRNWPAYYWMWGIGIVFMIFHMSESNFWLFKSIREDYIRDATIQWKSYGSFVGSWNMLVYGTALYLMSKIKDTTNIARGKQTFFFLFLGLTNLMFGWAHHTYMMPSPGWVRYLAYGVSMTEWIIFIKIIWSWSKSLSKKDKRKYSMTYKFILASDAWVFINLVMALFMSIPSFNYFSHGTHITVAHSMGTTIGINTCILFASLTYIISRLNGKEILTKFASKAYYLFNGSLFAFFATLVIMGIKKMIWQENEGTYGELHESSYGFYVVFVLSGIVLFCSIALIVVPMIRALLPYAVRATLSEKTVTEVEIAEEEID